MDPSRLALAPYLHAGFIDRLQEVRVIDRRTFLAGTGAVLLAAPLPAEAQQVSLPRIGFPPRFKRR